MLRIRKLRRYGIIVLFVFVFRPVAGQNFNIDFALTPSVSLNSRYDKVNFKNILVPSILVSKKIGNSIFLTTGLSVADIGFYVEFGDEDIIYVSDMKEQAVLLHLGVRKQFGKWGLSFSPLVTYSYKKTQFNSYHNKEYDGEFRNTKDRFSTGFQVSVPIVVLSNNKNNTLSVGPEYLFIYRSENVNIMGVQIAYTM